MIDDKKLGGRIRKMRTSKKINLTSFARKINKTPSYLTQIEQGKALPSITALREISRL